MIACNRQGEQSTRDRSSRLQQSSPRVAKLPQSLIECLIDTFCGRACKSARERSVGAICRCRFHPAARPATRSFAFTGLVIIRSSVNGVPFKYQIPSRPRNHLSAKSDGDTYAIRGEFRVRCANRRGGSRKRSYLHCKR